VEDDGDIMVESKPRLFIPGVKNWYVFDPVMEITAAELAELMPLLLMSPVAALIQGSVSRADGVYAGLSEGARRHIKVREVQVILGEMRPGRM
jgi:hypothetical protein